MSNYAHLYSERSVTVRAIQTAFLQAAFLQASLALFLAATPLSAQLGLGLTPMRLEIKFPTQVIAAAGATQSGSLTLTNGSPNKSRIRAEILDFFLDSQETPQFGRTYVKEAEYSCRNWLTVNPMETEIEPGATAMIRYTVKVPQGVAERGYHCAAGFTTLPPLDMINGNSLKTAVRVVSAFYVTVGTPEITGGLKDVTLERVGDKGWRAVVLMGNPGQIQYRPTGDLEIIDQNGKVVEKHSMNGIPVLPNRDQRFIIPVDSPMLGGGYYTLRARVDIGTHEIQEASVKVTPISSPGPNRIAGDSANPTAPTPPVSATGPVGPGAPKQ